MIHRYSHVVWDWNGTLLDDAALCVDIMNRMLRLRGLLPITLEFYQAAIEFPVERYYRKLGFDFTVEPFDRVSSEFVTLYQAGWRSCPLHKGARDTLTTLQRAGVSQSVLSASMTGYLVEQLDHHGLSGMLCKISGADNHHGRGKLHIANEHIGAVGVDPKKILFVGDTEHDAEAAAAAGCDCLLTSFGHYGRDRLNHLGVPVAGSMEDVISAVLPQC